MDAASNDKVYGTDLEVPGDEGYIIEEDPYDVDEEYKYDVIREILHCCYPELTKEAEVYAEELYIEQTSKEDEDGT